VSHVRQQIRERIAANVTGLTTTASRVYQSRVYNLASNEMPGLLIYSTQEASERDSFIGSNGLNRVVDVLVEGYAKTSTNLDDTLDTIAAEVEAAIAADPTCNGLAKDLQLASTEIEYTGESDSPTGLVRCTFSVVYRTTATAPTSAI
jgi:hypothetical protein